jgi:hypothetical protein
MSLEFGKELLLVHVEQEDVCEEILRRFSPSYRR